MKRTLVLLLVPAVLLLGAPSAQADDGDPDTWPLMHLATPSVCVVPDFAEVGSGWPVHEEVANWNAAQSSVLLTFGRTAGCSEVRVHQYRVDDDSCGYTDYPWTDMIFDGGAGATLYPSADIYLNTWCLGTRHAAKYIIGHELGHALGLPHSTSKRSIMSVWYRSLEWRGAINPVDARSLAILWAQ